MKARKTLVMATTALLAVAGAVLVQASPAAAATKLCTITVNHQSAGHNMAVPAARDGDDNCLIGNGNLGCFGSGCGAVKTLQGTLNRCYGAGLVVDGEFGPKTRAALINAQRRAGTSPDGTYGPNTKRAIRHQSNDVPTRCEQY